MDTIRYHKWNKKDKPLRLRIYNRKYKISYYNCNTRFYFGDNFNKRTKSDNSVKSKLSLY